MFDVPTRNSLDDDTYGAIERKCQELHFTERAFALHDEIMERRRLEDTPTRN